MKMVLVIDDEPEVVDPIKDCLEGNGYRVATAYSGEEGLEKALSAPPDIILLDILMPQMDGYEVLRRLRAVPGTRHTPILILTAKGETSSILKSQELRVSDYLIKPVTLEALLDSVRKHLVLCI